MRLFIHATTAVSIESKRNGSAKGKVPVRRGGYEQIHEMKITLFLTLKKCGLLFRESRRAKDFQIWSAPFRETQSLSQIPCQPDFCLSQAKKHPLKLSDKLSRCEACFNELDQGQCTNTVLRPVHFPQERSHT